jgi:hypothetical protein
MKAIETLLPALIFEHLAAEYTFDPPSDLDFEWGLELPPPSVSEAIELITGSSFSEWTHSDSAALLRFLNSQPTGEWSIIEGDVVSGS